MKFRSIWVVLAFVLAEMLQAQSWLPSSSLEKKDFRLLECNYQEADLKNCKEIGDSSVWSVDIKEETLLNGISYIFTFTSRQNIEQAGVAVAFDEYEWSSDNYVMLPSSVYNGNRQRIVNRSYATGLDQSDYYRKDLALTSNPIPQLSPEFGAPSLLEVSICNVATPAIVYLDRRSKKGTIILTEQGIEREDGAILDYGLIVNESADRSQAAFIISAPGVRSRKPEFIGFSASPDRGISVNKGDKIVLRITKFTYPCENVPQLLKGFMQTRKTYAEHGRVRNLMPMSEVFACMTRNIDERYYKSEQSEFYCPENADWMSYGWVGGLINTYPMLALGDTLHLHRVKNTFNFALSKGYGAAGYFYDVLGADGKVVYRDAASLNPQIGLTRKNADILYWMVKQLTLLKKQGKAGEITPEWETSIRRLADAFVATWRKFGTWGNYVNVESGDIAVYNTTGGAMAVGGLALAACYFDEPDYLRVACEAAAMYYGSFALLGFTSGGCGDILQNADSETAAALMTSLMTLYEVTGNKAYLQQAADLAHLCATWTVSFPYRLPKNTPLAKLGANLTGAVWASTQNKHGAPGFCTQSGDALFKLYRATGDTLYADLLRDIIHAHVEGIQPNGKITERLTYCDADSRGSRGDGGKTGWNETNGALMALEIPGIYLRTDCAKLYVFDHVSAQIVKQTDKRLVLEITNPTAYDAIVTLCVENSEEAEKPLGVHAFMQWNRKIKVKAGKSMRYVVNI